MSGSPQTRPAADIIPFAEEWAQRVIELFRAVNRDLAPVGMEARFDAYVERSITEEIGRIATYYRDHGGGFWVAVDGQSLLGMFGLEDASGGGKAAMELRRMYVAPSARRRGLARTMLRRAAIEAQARGAVQMTLSTSDVQTAAIALYEAEGFGMVRMVEADAATTKSIGGMRRLYMVRDL